MDVKIRLTEFGGAAEATPEETVKFIEQLHARATKAEADAKSATEETAKMKAENTALSTRIATTETCIVEIQKAQDTDRFTVLFDKAKAEQRVDEAEREDLMEHYLGKSDKFSAYLGKRQPRRNTSLVGSPNGDSPPAATSATAKFMAEVAVVQSTDKNLTFTEAAARVGRDKPDLAQAYSDEQAKRAPNVQRGSGVPDGEEV